MFTEKITLLNQTVLECLNETNETKIVRCFTEAGIAVLGASFGFTWLNSGSSNKFRLVYKSKNLPYTPRRPREKGRNYKVINSSIPDFVSDIESTPDAHYVKKYMKSFVIIPIAYREQVYGNIVLCFKEKEIFAREKKALSVFIGNSAAQAITINRLIISQEEAILTKEKLKEESLRRDFIADTTHEIRTPLAIIRGNADLALTLGKNGKLKSSASALQAINYEVEHLSNLLSDLTLLTTNQTGVERMILAQPVNLSELMEVLLKRVKVLTHRKNISIQLSGISPLLCVKGDRAYFEKLFLNLIKNAIYYNRLNGWIKIKARKRKNEVIVTVQDNGIGISKEDLPRIFERFYRAEKVRDPEGKRTGLGLAISKWIVDIHAGTIHASSIPKKGSTFSVILPLLKS